jgi:hypothetical protein
MNYKVHFKLDGAKGVLEIEAGTGREALSKAMTSLGPTGKVETVVEADSGRTVYTANVSEINS